MDRIRTPSPEKQRHTVVTPPTALATDLEDLDEEEYEEMAPMIPNDSECQVVSLVLPDGNTNIIIVNEDKDTLASLRRKINKAPKEKPRRRASTVDSVIPGLQFSYESQGTVKPIPREYELLNFKELISHGEIKESLKDDCLVLHLTPVQRVSEELLQKKPQETLRAFVKVSICNTQETKDQVLVLRENIPKPHLALLDLTGEEETFLKIRDIEECQVVEPPKVRVSTKSSIEVASFEVNFKDPELMQQFLEVVSSVQNSYEKSTEFQELDIDELNDSKHYSVKKINRYGFKQKRYIWFSKVDMSFHIANTKYRNHKTYELKHVAHFVKRGKREKKISVEFEEESKQKELQLVFTSVEDLEDFFELTEKMLSCLQETKFQSKNRVIITQQLTEKPSKSLRKYTWLNHLNSIKTSKKTAEQEIFYNVIQLGFISHEKRLLVLDTKFKEISIRTPDYKVVKTLPIPEIFLSFFKEDLRKVKLELSKQVIELVFPSVYMKYHFTSLFHQLRYPKRTKIQTGRMEGQEFNVLASTWNLGTREAPDSVTLEEWLGSAGEHSLVVLSFQECKKSKRVSWLTTLSSFLEEMGFCLLSFNSMWEMFMVVYIKEEWRDCVSELRSLKKPTGIAHIMGNKGGLITSFKVEETSFCFLSCHLAARENRVMQRNQNIKDLVEMKPGRLDIDFTIEFDYIFFIGDMNYRIEEDYNKAVEVFDAKDYSSLWNKDQLTIQKKQNLIMTNFQEAPLNFKPTYRLSKTSSEWSNKRNQTPSWTDRILFKSHKEVQVKQYTALENCLGSDHRPVVGSYQVRVMPWFIPEELPPVTEDPKFAVIEFKSLSVDFFEAQEVCLVQISFYAPFLQRLPLTPQIEIQDIHHFEFEPFCLPMLTIVFPQFNFLYEQRIIASVWFGKQDGKQEVGGQCSIPLNSLMQFCEKRFPRMNYRKSLNTNEGSSVEVFLESGTKIVGKLKANWSYNICSRDEQLRDIEVHEL